MESPFPPATPETQFAIAAQYLEAFREKHAGIPNVSYIVYVSKSAFNWLVEKGTPDALKGFTIREDTNLLKGKLRIHVITELMPADLDYDETEPPE